VRVRHLFKEDTYRRDVRRGRNDVVRHLVINHAPALPDHVLKEGVADALRHAAFYLACGHDGIDDAAHFLQGHEILHARFIRRGVHGDFGHVDGPSESAVSVAPVLLVVPVNLGRLLVLAEGFELAVFREILAAGAREVFRRVGVREKTAVL
jgi:hypothetical protein